jgi:SAM-dependent methyltransferase
VSRAGRSATGVMSGWRPWRTSESGAGWAAHLDDEVRFWDDYLRTRGLQWPDEYAERVDPEAMLREQQILTRLPDSGTVRILDVGAGPLTVLGKRAPGVRLELVPVDPLAAEYDRLLERHGVMPPVRTRYCEGERLTDVFPRGSFDLAYARNALDHARDPKRVILRMLQVVRSGGWLILRHRPNEAETAGYQDLHTWNFDEIGGEFWIWSRDSRHNMHAVLRFSAEVSWHRDGEWLVCVIRKLSARDRLRRLPAALAGSAWRRPAAFAVRTVRWLWARVSRTSRDGSSPG